VKNIFADYGILLGKRYTKAQKDKFIQYITADMKEIGYEAALFSGKDKKTVNIIFGSPEKSNTVLIANYDTGSKVFYPGYKYYPLNAKKNITGDVVNQLITLLTGALLFVLAYVSYKYGVNGGEGGLRALTAVISAGAVILALYIMAGIPNSINYSRNSASIAVIRKIAGVAADKNKVSFILTDKCVSSYDGYNLANDWFKSHNIDGGNKRVVVLDSLTGSADIVLAHTEQAGKTAGALLQCQGDLNIKEIVLDEEKVKITPAGIFDKALILAGGRLADNELVVENTRTGKDFDVNLERVGQLVSMLAQFIDG